MGMTIDEAIDKYKNQAEWERSHNNTDYYEEYEQIAKWLEKLQKIKQIMSKRPKDMISSNPTLRAISEVLEDGNEI